ncbi:MAG TPA: type IV pilus assembly protein PilM [Acidimicrobiales bacterium]|nr:type IV pilus assembly protein PilM [Acidimicrobiales bacterium]
MAPGASKRVGLEISNSAVRIAEVNLGGRRPKLVNLGQVRLPPRAVVDGAIADVPAVVAAIQRCLSEGNFAAKEVHLGIAGLRAITRELDMPHVPDSELDSAVRLQALDVIPFPVDKTVMSARPLEELTGPDGTAIRRVLLAAAHRDLVDPLLDAVQAAGLTPISIDLTSTALIRALYDPSASLGGPEAIVAIGAGLTTVIVHEEGVPHFVRTIAEGGDTITAAIAGALDLPIDDAEATKRNLDQSGPHIRAAATAANEAATSLIAEIRSSIEYYSTLPGRSEIRRVTLTGGGSRLSGLLERLQQNLRAQVVRGSALSRIDTNLKPDEIANRDPLCAVVIGLALPEPPGVKPLDLMPPEILQARKRARTDRVLIVAAAVLVLAMIGGGVLRYLSVHSAENNVSSLKAQIAATNLEITKYDLAQQKYQEVASDQAVLTPIVADEVNWPAVLGKVTDYTPSGGYITSFAGSDAAPPVATTSANGRAVAPPPRSETEISTVAVGVTANGCVIVQKGQVPNCAYAYFENWATQLAKSNALQLVTWSSFNEGTGGVVTYTATLGVLGTIPSSRATRFEVLGK